MISVFFAPPLTMRDIISHNKCHLHGSECVAFNFHNMNMQNTNANFLLSN